MSHHVPWKLTKNTQTILHCSLSNNDLDTSIFLNRRLVHESDGLDITTICEPNNFFPSLMREQLNNCKIYRGKVCP